MHTITIESKKRYKRMVVAFALCISLLIGSAFALTPSYQKVSMPDPYGVMPLSMNDSDYSRTLSWNGDIKFGIPSNTVSFGGSGSLTYVPEQGVYQMWSGSYGTSGFYFYAGAGSYVDITSAVSLSSTTYPSMIVSGSGQFFLYNTNIYYQIVPQLVYVLINGIQTGPAFEVDSTGNFTISDLKFDLSSNVTSIGLRFMYSSDTVVSNTISAGSSTRNAIVYFNDDTVFTPQTTNVLPYEPFFERVIAWEQTINNSVLSLKDTLSASLGGSVEKLVSVFARDDDIQLRDDVDDTLKEVTTQFYDQTSTSSSSMTVETVQNVKGIADGMDAMFSSGYSVSDAFTEIAYNDDFMSWFTAETAQALDSTGNVVTVGDDDPYNMHYYYDQVNAIAERRGD